MNAGPVSLLSLISDASKRFVVPVYQRPYSWDEEQCEQLWEDVLSAGRRGEGNHFTGSVVWIQDGIMSATGVTPLLLIDGQQRVTTLMLLLVALAEFARAHPNNDDLNFSFEEIIGSGYLVGPYKKGEDHYRMTLSQGDRETFLKIIDHLESPEVETDDEARRLVDNLDFFRTRLNAVGDPNSVWNGISRLEVVSISLDQRADKPQLIFESMNSTGKDLSTADLVRNYVLMGMPLEEQDSLYENHWRKIEETLGADSYDEVFDEFLRDWLTVINAPTPLVSRDVYRVFKRYAEVGGYDKADRVAGLLKEIRRYAGYYARVNSGVETDPELAVLFGRLKQLDMSVVTPLLMYMLNEYEESSGTFSRADLVEVLHTIESYLFRRSVCGLASNGLGKFFLSIIGRLRELQSDGLVDVKEAFEAILLGEEATVRRMPHDADFEQSLLTRDSYSFRGNRYLLATLENFHHPKNPINFLDGKHTIEHIMPQNALAHEEWRDILGPDAESVHQHYVNTLGNLTLTAYNSELSDGSFETKKARAVGGYKNEYLTISRELHDTDSWTIQLMQSRARRLASDAIKIWPMPTLPPETIEKYRVKRKTLEAPTRAVTFRMLCAAGLLSVGDTLERASSQNSECSEKATITNDYRLRLDNGEEFDSPSGAAGRVLQLAGSGSTRRNGWKFWTCNGKLLDDVRGQFLVDNGGLSSVDRMTFLSMFWGDFFDYCSGREDFISIYGDPSSRADQRSVWVSFSFGRSDFRSGALVGKKDGYIAVELYFTDIDSYKKLLSIRSKVGDLFADRGGDVQWDGVDTDKKSRHVVIMHPADFEADAWEGMFKWLADSLVAIRQVASLLDEIPL